MFAFAGCLCIWKKPFKEVVTLGITHKKEGVYCSTVFIDSGAMHNFVSAVLIQAVQATTINTEPMCVTLGNKFKVLSTRLAKASILFASGATQMVWCHVMP